MSDAVLKFRVKKVIFHQPCYVGRASLDSYVDAGEDRRVGLWYVPSIASVLVTFEGRPNPFIVGSGNLRSVEILGDDINPILFPPDSNRAVSAPAPVAQASGAQQPLRPQQGAPQRR